ncbi:ribosomal processing protein [Plasmodium vivax Mauritania I]|uniref:Ribosomal processing protein n=1 Tax=Plasmodium vivax Mauritania I TaxID=1035515 RepID=A0A0J9W4V1_PLAVI|nr:ribosomal processing protein [Plasmodium vivax Mauritania I]
MISDEDSPFLIENLRSTANLLKQIHLSVLFAHLGILQSGKTKVVHDKRKKYVDDVFDLTLRNLRSGRGKTEKSQEIDLSGASNEIQNFESYLERERHNRCAFSAKANYDSENFDGEEHVECSPGFRNDEEIRLFNESVKRKFFNDLLDYYNVLKLEHFYEGCNCGQSVYPCFEKTVLDNSPVGAKHVAPGWRGNAEQPNHRSEGKTKHLLLTSDKKCMQRSGVSKSNTHGRVTPQFVLSNGMIKKKNEILENAFRKLEEKLTATQDKQFTSFLPSCGDIEGDSEGGERKSTHKGSNKRNEGTKEATRGNKGLESCKDLANDKIEAAASFQPTDGDKSKCTNGGDLTKCGSKIWCSKKCANVPKFHSGLSLTLPNGGEDLREMIDRRGVPKNGKVDRKKKEGRKVNVNKNHDRLGRDALPCDERRSHVSLQIGGASRLGHSSLNEEGKKGNLPQDEPEVDTSETNTSLSSDLKDSKMSRKRICKGSTILSPIKRFGRNQKSGEKIAHERATSDSSNGIEKRRMFREHSRRKTVYKGEPKKKRLRKNKSKLKKRSMDSFETGKGHNFTRERKKGDREKWENKLNSGRFEGDSLEGEILEGKKKKGKLPPPKGSEQFVCYVDSRGNKTEARKCQGCEVSSVESSKSDTHESGSSADLGSNWEGYRGHGSRRNDGKVQEGRPLRMFKLSKKGFHFCEVEGDVEKLEMCGKHRSGEKVEYDQKGEYFFSDKCREMHANMADANLKNGVSPDVTSKRVLGGEQDHQNARKGEGSSEGYSYVSLEEGSKNGAHNVYFGKSKYTSLRGKCIPLSGVGDIGEAHSEADLSNSGGSARVGYVSGGEHRHGSDDDKYRFPFCDEMYEGGKLAGEVDPPRGDSIPENGNRSRSGSRSGSRRGQDDLYLAFQEPTSRGEKALPDELLQSEQPPINAESEHSDDALLRRREYVQGQICRILKKENWDGEAESMLNLFFRYVRVEGRCVKNGHTLIRKNLKRDEKGIRKGGRGKRGNTTGEWKQEQQKEDLGRGENGGMDKLERVYLDDAPRSLPLTMLVVRNYEEGGNHHKQEQHHQQREERNFRGARKKVSVRYKVELTGVKNPMGIKKAVEKEKKLFSRIERIYDYCASDGEASGERYGNNLVDRFIPFPNMGWSFSKQDYQHEVVGVHSEWAQERKRVFFAEEREKLINEDSNHKGGKGLMLEDALLRVPTKGGTNNANKFGKSSPFAKWNVNVCSRWMKQPGGKNPLVKKGPKGVATHFDRKGPLKCSLKRGAPVVGGRPEGSAIRIGTPKKFTLPRKSALEGSYPKSKEAKWGGGHHVTNFKEYLTEVRNPRGGNKTEGPFPKDGQKREDSRDIQLSSPLRSSIVKIVDDKKGEQVTIKSFSLPRGVEAEAVKRENWNRPEGELGSCRQLDRSSSGHVFKGGGGKRDEDFALVSGPPRDQLDPLVSAHNGSQKGEHNVEEGKGRVEIYHSKNFRGKKEHKEGENKKGASNTFEDSYARKSNRDGDHPCGSFKTDRQSCKAVENGAQSLDEGGSSGEPPRREEEPTANQTEEGTKTSHVEGSKVGKEWEKENGLEQEVDALNTEGSPRKLPCSSEAASPRKNNLRRMGALTGGSSTSHLVSRPGKEKQQNCNLGPSAEKKIAKGKDQKDNTAKGFSKKSEFYDFTNFGKNVEEIVSPLVVAEEGDPLKPHEGRSPPNGRNKNEIRLSAPHATSHMSNAPRKEGTHEGNNPKRTTNLVGRRKSCRIDRRGKSSPRAMGSFPHKMTQREMDKPVLKNEKGKARNSNYVDLRHIECSKSTLEFFLEKKYLKRDSPGEGMDEGASLGATHAGTSTRGAEKGEALIFAQIKAAHTPCTLRLNDETKAAPFADPFATHGKDEAKLKRPSHVHSSKSSLSYRLTNAVRVKRNIYLSDSDVEPSLRMDSRGREDAGVSFTGKEEETQTGTGVEEREETEVEERAESGVGEQIGQTGDHNGVAQESAANKSASRKSSAHKSDQRTAPHKDNREDAGKAATTLRKAPGKKAKPTDHFLTIKVNIITVFLQSSYVKRMNMNVSYNIQVAIYSSSDRKTIEKNCRKETFPCYFSSHTSGIGLSSDAFKKIDPIELKTYSLSRNKKYASETGGSNDDLYEMNGNAGGNTRAEETPVWCEHRALVE